MIYHKNKQLWQYLLIGLGIFLLISIFFYVFHKGLEKHEQLECLKWQQWEKDYPLHYPTNWQIEQCNHHNIFFN